MKITQLSRQQPPGLRKRFAGSLAVGALVAGALVAWTDLHSHAALVAAANAPEPKGVHETVGSILASGGIGMFLIVTLVVFLTATAVARIRRARPAAASGTPGYSYAVPAKRGR